MSHGSSERTTIIVREFLYLDPSLVDQFLAQVEGGLFDEEQEKHIWGGGRKVGGKGGVGPLSAEIGLDRTAQNEAERVMRQTAESRFDRLHRRFTETGNLQPLQAVDEEIWYQLRRGELLEVEAALKLSGAANLMRLLEFANSIGPLMQVFGSSDTDAQENLAKMAQIRQVTSANGTIPVIAHLLDTPDFKLLCQLRTEALRVAIDELTGEATIFGKVQRLLRKDEEVPAGDLIPGMNVLPREQRRKLERSLASQQEGQMPFGDFSVTAPAALFTPVAIYR